MLIARLGAREVDWVGTSLGGFIGLIMAGMADSPIRSLLINDIGPFVPWAALRRIGDYLRVAPKAFQTLDAAEAYFRDILAPFGALTDGQWRHLTEHSVVPEPDGGYRLPYDPGIAEAFRPGRVYNVSLWTYWDAITCPVLVLRGETSDLLPAGTALEMTRRGPQAALIEIPGCGHAPALLDDDQIALVSDWLERVR
jgi:pimeloyl-ACP methyl ester carboxylesterase